MVTRARDSRRRWLLLAFLLLGAACAAFAWATHVTPAPELPMDQVELERSPTDARVVRVVNAATQHPYRCYRLPDAGAATAVLAVGEDAQTWDSVANLLVARLQTAPGEVTSPSVAVGPVLESYDGQATVLIRLGTRSVKRVMASQAAAERLSALLQQGLLVTGRTTHLMEQPPRDQTFTLELGEPLPDAECQP
jgi:hypothetical protein